MLYFHLIAARDSNKTTIQTGQDGSSVGNGLVTIEGYGTLPASKAQTLQKEDDNVNAVMDKI